MKRGDFSHDFPPPFVVLLLLFKHRYYDEDDSAETRFFFATSTQKSSCLDNGEMTRTVIRVGSGGGGPFSGAGFKTDPISERRGEETGERERGGSLGFWTPPDKGWDWE